MKSTDNSNQIREYHSSSTSYNNTQHTGNCEEGMPKDVENAIMQEDFIFKYKVSNNDDRDNATITEWIREVEHGVYSNCDIIESITIPSNVTEVRTKGIL